MGDGRWGSVLGNRDDGKKELLNSLVVMQGDVLVLDDDGWQKPIKTPEIFD